MRRPNHRSIRTQAQMLSAYWDEVARRAPAEPVPPADLDHDLATTVRQVSAIPGDAAPDPRFAAELLDRIVAVSQEKTTMSSASPVSLSRVRVRPGGRSSSPDSRPLPNSTPAPRWRPVVAIASIAALVLAALWLTSLRGDDPSNRHDTTAIAAAGTPVATLPVADTPATPAPANQTVGSAGNALFYTAVVDLSGPTDTAGLWLIDVAPGAYLFPADADSHLVMPLSGTLQDRDSGTPVD